MRRDENDGYVPAGGGCRVMASGSVRRCRRGGRPRAKVVKSSSAQKLAIKQEGGKTSQLWGISCAGPLLSLMTPSH